MATTEVLPAGPDPLPSRFEAIRRTVPWWSLLVLLIPIAVYVIYLLLPVVGLVRSSIRVQSPDGSLSAVTGQNYVTVATTSYYLHGWLTTLRLSAESALITTVVGSIVAWGLWRTRPSRRGLLLVIVIAPILVSGVVRDFGWLAIAGPSGPINDVTRFLGLGSNKIIFHPAGVILGFSNVFLPLTVIVLLTRLDAVSVSIIRAAASLGADTRQIVRRVVAPAMWPAMWTAFVLIFTLSAAAYDVPTILGGGRVLTISQIIFEEQTVVYNQQVASALSVTLVALVLICLALSQGLSKIRVLRQRRVGPA